MTLQGMPRALETERNPTSTRRILRCIAFLCPVASYLSRPLQQTPSTVHNEQADRPGSPSCVGSPRCPSRTWGWRRPQSHPSTFPSALHCHRCSSPDGEGGTFETDGTWRVGGNQNNNNNKRLFLNTEERDSMTYHSTEHSGHVDGIPSPGAVFGRIFPTFRIHVQNP